jgi:ribosomal protein S18 acetylase RimI-like enzyme
VTSAARGQAADDLVVRNLRLEDLAEVATIHRAAFPASLITRLGPGAVRRYYVWQLSGPHDVVALGAYREGRCLGFCFGGVFRGATSGFLRRHRLYLAACLARRPWLLMELPILARVRRGLHVMSPEFERSSPAPSGPSFGILAIAVDPRVRGTGVGRLLMERSEAVAVERGFPQMNLSVSPENTHAVSFYEQLGWIADPVQQPWEGAMKKDLGR